MIEGLERIEPVLCNALAAVKRGDWPMTHGVLSACVEYAELHRAAVYAECSSTELLRRITSLRARTIELRDRSPAVTLLADLEQMTALCRVLARGAVLEHDAVLIAEILEVDAVPVLRLSINGPGRFPSTLDLGFGLTVFFDDCERIWTRATRGGRMDARQGGLDLRLKGVRAIQDAPTGCDEVVVDLRAAENLARILAAGEDAGNVDTHALRVILDRLLAWIDTQDDPLQPCDIAALVRAFMGDVSIGDATAPVKVDMASELPPLTVRRNRIARLLRSAWALANAALRHGGTAQCTINYESQQRAVSILFSGHGKTDCDAGSVYVPTIVRAIEAHGGDVETDFQSDEFTLFMLIPDVIARSLDEWLPGWNTCSPRSIQMLRMLKSGGPVPPEDIVLAGVLEDELERRLLPRLAVAPAATLVHDLRPRQPLLSTASAQRIEKVLAQLKRGKPKKEICAPAYAAEILWMFSADDRHAGAIGLKPGSSEITLDLCKELINPQISYPHALRLLLQVVEAS